MFVSVVLAAYNEENWIRTALDSLMQQTVPFELIVVDNDSTDRTVEIAREYTSLVFSAARGVCNARNLGVLKASGEVVVFVDADCYYAPNFLETITHPFNDPNVLLVSGIWQPYGERMNSVGRLRILAFYLFNYTPGSAVAYRRDAFLAVGGYEPDGISWVKTVWSQEYQINWKLRQLGKFRLVPSAIAGHTRPREACVMCLLDGPEALCKWCEEISVERF
ncbi:hypothetical protein CH330_01265 [candidate division WOR-3 bacterium JGI_Cruoil_03_51_56]|uniref:Glycosyltransferase 2-like domain-containing protein n=1 Tax=candidate division WOR-3 bacterium JGI_Cruoil_03_51_56 TaxID=1973747 RepID=A0A235BZG3_UNCW3|nr:MAG: hypothetical protein CH330_01265 [candidate division WOR-3 bacterium JGI_Cruoil_03_51_56]